MADMTHKHHNLIYDAIEEAATEFVKTLPLRDNTGNSSERFSKRALNLMVGSLAKSFSTRLRYTNDKFEAAPWKHQVEALVNEIWNKRA